MQCANADRFLMVVLHTAHNPFGASALPLGVVRIKQGGSADALGGELSNQH